MLNQNDPETECHALGLEFVDLVTQLVRSTESDSNGDPKETEKALQDLSKRCEKAWQCAFASSSEVRPRVGRVYLCLDTLLKVLHPHLRCDTSAVLDLIPWNELHKGLQDTRLEPCEPMQVVKVSRVELGDWWDQLVLDVASDLAHAMRPLHSLLPEAPLQPIEAVDALASLLAALGLSKDDQQRFRNDIELFPALLDRTTVKTRYALADFELDFLASRRMILEVPSWEGELLFPDFQFTLLTDDTLVAHPDFPVLRQDVVEVLRNTPLSFQGWKACLWFAANGLADVVADPGIGQAGGGSDEVPSPPSADGVADQDATGKVKHQLGATTTSPTRSRTEINNQESGPVGRTGSRHNKNNLSFWRTKLSEIGLWLPNWKVEAEGLFAEYWPKTTPKPDRDSSLYRVTKTKYDSPFWYSDAFSPAQYKELVKTNRSVRERREAEEPCVPGGRFDPHKSNDLATNVGALYFSEQAEGCWAEVFDREPAIFLDDVLQRKHWECKVSACTFDLVDFTRLPVAISATTHRAESQALTHDLLKKNKSGLRYSLRSRVGAVGVVLFGESGTEQAPKGLTLEDSKEHNVGDHPAAWKALHEISAERKGRTVRFRRFPPSRDD